MKKVNIETEAQRLLRLRAQARRSPSAARIQSTTAAFERDPFEEAAEPSTLGKVGGFLGRGFKGVTAPLDPFVESSQRVQQTTGGQALTQGALATMRPFAKVQEQVVKPGAAFAMSAPQAQALERVKALV